jgi:hypothetical protein
MELIKLFPLHARSLLSGVKWWAHVPSKTILQFKTHSIPLTSFILNDTKQNPYRPFFLRKLFRYPQCKIFTQFSCSFGVGVNTTLTGIKFRRYFTHWCSDITFCEFIYRGFHLLHGVNYCSICFVLYALATVHYNTEDSDKFNLLVNLRPFHWILAEKLNNNALLYWIRITCRRHFVSYWYQVIVLSPQL